MVWLLILFVLGTGLYAGPAVASSEYPEAGFHQGLLPPRWPAPFTLVEGASVLLIDARSGQILIEQAAALGLTSASFADPHGLFADNVMSALDVARLSETLEPEIGPSDVFPL